MTARATALALAATLLAACSPNAPRGVDKAVLDEAVSRAIGDPNTCVIIAEKGSGRTVYRYGTYVACERGMPSCGAGSNRSAADLAKAVAADEKQVNASCPSNADGSRGVGWAAGPIEGRDIVYAAAMEGAATPPGLIIADKLESAFRRAGLGPER